MSARLELVGSHITILTSSNPFSDGLEGEVVDETKSTFVLSTSKGYKRILKHTIVFERNGAKYDGSSFIGRPHERLKNGN